MKPSVRSSLSALVLAVALSVGTTLAPAHAELRPVDWIVAVVDAEIVTYTQLIEEMRISAARGGRGIESLGPEERATLADGVLDRLLIDALLVQEARRRGITVTPAEIEEATTASIDRMRSQFADEQAYERALASQFTTPERLRERYRQTSELQLLRQKLIDREIRRKIRIGDSDVVEAWQRRGDEVRVRHILVGDSPSAHAVRARLARGDDFDAVGREAQALEAADLGWMRRGTLVLAFEEVAFAMRTPNELSQPVKTRFGWHVIQLLERRSAELPELTEDLKDRISNEIFSSRFDALFEEYVQGLRESAYVEIREDAIPLN